MRSEPAQALSYSVTSPSADGQVVGAARERRLRPRVNSQAIATATNMVSKLIGMDWLTIQAAQVAMMITMASSGYQNQFLRANLMMSKAASKRTNKTPTVRSVGAID